jgi:hypothetical protein
MPAELDRARIPGDSHCFCRAAAGSFPWTAQSNPGRSKENPGTHTPKPGLQVQGLGHCVIGLGWGFLDASLGCLSWYPNTDLLPL